MWRGHDPSSVVGLFKVCEIDSAKYACLCTRTLKGRFLGLLLNDIVGIQDTMVSLCKLVCFHVLLIILSPASSSQDCAFSFVWCCYSPFWLVLIIYTSAILFYWKRSFYSLRASTISTSQLAIRTKIT